MGQLRSIVHAKLDPDEKSSWSSRFIDLFLIGLIAVNVIAVILETVESFENRYHDLFWVIETISVAVFSIEYVARIWTCVEDPKYRD